MIDVVREVSAFQPVDLSRIPEKYRPATEQMRSAFILYNKALHEIQTGHDDAAKNFLRKAVTIFPDFYDAVMVLGILVFANGDRIGAVRIFNSVRDLEQRAVSIGILDHLVEEAERPETSRTYGTKRYSAEAGKAESVMGGSGNAHMRPEPGEAKYSRGQIFDKSSSYYEPQPRASHASSRLSPPQRSSKSGTGSVRRTTNRMAEPRSGQEASAHSQDVNDVRTLNKYLLIIIAILIIFAVVVSTMLINRTASERELRRKLEEAATPTASDNTPGPSDPTGTPPAGEGNTPAA